MMQMDSQLRTLQKKRTANFREDETKLLIQLWGSPSIQNKLFLTHRKAPVMRLLAANMQQRGFFRTPDEIKTRIRNLKCLYHRIKRSMACGTGIGTVDPDWPHYKAMDEILSKDYPRKLTDRILEEQMETTKFEDVHVKQEIDDIDVDDNDSWATNESLNSEYEEESQMSGTATPPITTSAPVNKPIAGTIQVKKTSLLQAPISQQNNTQHHVTFTQIKNHIPIQPAPKVQPTILPIQLPGTQVTQAGAGQKGGIPFPLLILNNLNNHGDKNAANRAQAAMNNMQNNDSLSELLKELIDLQKHALTVSKENLEIEKQRLEFDRLIGTQLVTLMPMLGGLLQRLTYPGNPDHIDMKFNRLADLKRKRSASEDADMATDSKILRTMLEQGIRKYMGGSDDDMGDDEVEKPEQKDLSDDRSENELQVDEDAKDDDDDDEHAKDDDDEDKEDTEKHIEIIVEPDQDDALIVDDVELDEDEEIEDNEDKESEKESVHESEGDCEKENQSCVEDQEEKQLVIATRRSSREKSLHKANDKNSKR